MVEVSILDKTVVDKEILAAAGACCGLRLADKSGNVQQIGLLLYGHQVLIYLVADQGHDPLTQVTYTQVELLNIIMGKFKSYIGMRHRNAGKLIQDMTQFRSI
ncbi:hypothetical protein D3C86_1297910 [compost metagenome]